MLWEVVYIDWETTILRISNIIFDITLGASVYKYHHFACEKDMGYRRDYNEAFSKKSRGSC